MANKKILIVDDEKNTLNLLEIILKKQGYDIETQAQALNLPQKIQAFKPDLLMLDLILQETDGIKVLQELKQHNELRSLPVVVLTSYQDIDTKMEALSLGAVDYIAKPFHKEELVLRVKNILNLCNQAPQAPLVENSLIKMLFRDKNDILVPNFDKNYRFGYTYQQAISLLNPDNDEKLIQQLNEFVSNKFLKKEFYDSVYLCPHCQHHHIILRTGCPQCNIGLEIDNESTTSKCPQCQQIVKPALNFKCSNCGKIINRAELLKKNFYKYSLADVIAPVRVELAHEPKVIQPEETSKVLQPAETTKAIPPVETTKVIQPLETTDAATLICNSMKEAKFNFVEFVKFEKQFSQLISHAGTTKQNITVMSMEFEDVESIFKKMGVKEMHQFLRNLFLVFRKYFRQVEAITYKHDVIILFLLPRLHLSMAKLLAEKVQDYLSKINYDMELKIKLASYPEDGFTEKEILAVLDLDFATVEEKLIP